MNTLQIANAITSGEYTFSQIAIMFDVRVKDVERIWDEMNNLDAWHLVQISEPILQNI
jgi:hypothetical protein